jgi:uncharacterized BrkB/YihY/UPF0761 family membrane protein
MTHTTPDSKIEPRSRRRLAGLLLLVLTLVVLAIVISPVFLILPFKAQSPRGLALSFLFRRWSPLLTLLASVLSLALTIWLWHGTKWWRKGVLAIALLLTFAATWFARQNHFEWMFHPLPNAAYAKAADAGFMSDNDRVMAVAIGGEAVAYPIRLMAYHHVLADTVNGVPIVATY